MYRPIFRNPPSVEDKFAQAVERDRFVAQACERIVEKRLTARKPAA